MEIILKIILFVYQCKSVLKWTSENGTRVMTHHNCLILNLHQQLHLDNEQSHRIVTQSSSSKECPLIQKRITEACVEYCAVDCRSFESVAGAGFINLAKQLICAGATLGTSVSCQ